jgi:glutathione S-transferase
MLSLVGQYGSPFVRRVAVSFTVLELPFERQPLSVFADAEALLSRNPLGRVPGPPDRGR